MLTGYFTSEVIAVHETFIVGRKLTMMLRCTEAPDPLVSLNCPVQVFVKRYKEKGGRWLSPRALLSICRSASILSLLGPAGRPILVALENVRHFIVDNDIAQHGQKSNDVLQFFLDHLFNEPLEGNSYSAST